MDMFNQLRKGFRQDMSEAELKDAVQFNEWAREKELIYVKLWSASMKRKEVLLVGPQSRKKRVLIVIVLMALILLIYVLAKY